MSQPRQQPPTQTDLTALEPEPSQRGWNVRFFLNHVLVHVKVPGVQFLGAAPHDSYVGKGLGVGAWGLGIVTPPGVAALSLSWAGLAPWLVLTVFAVIFMVMAVSARGTLKAVIGSSEPMTKTDKVTIIETTTATVVDPPDPTE